MTELLSDDSILDWLREREGWRCEENVLAKEYRFHSFRDAIIFMNRVATVAHDADHYPDIHIRKSRIRLRIGSGRADGPTRRDVELAELMDRATSKR